MTELTSPFVTTTSSLPATCAAVFAVISVAETTVTDVASLPIVTFAPDTKPVPVIFTDVPPAVVPSAASTFVTVAGTANVYSTVELCVTSSSLTSTSAVPSRVRSRLRREFGRRDEHHRASFATNLDLRAFHEPSAFDFHGRATSRRAFRRAERRHRRRRHKRVVRATSSRVPSASVTTTSALPAACAAVFAVISVADTTTTELASPPIVTFAPDTKPVPVTFTDAPPAVEPSVGLTAVTFGAARYVKSTPAVELISPTVTMTSSLPQLVAAVFAVISVSLLTSTSVASLADLDLRAS